MVVLVTGSNGQLGQAIHSLQENYPFIDFIFCSSSELDITDLEKCRLIFYKFKPDFCINAAAYTAVDKAETEPEKAFLINVQGVHNIAVMCKECNSTLLHISTDFVFNGRPILNSEGIPRRFTEKDKTNPINVYGATKLEGEQRVQTYCEKYFIIRTSWVYSEFGNNFMKTMLRLASERKTISVVNDQIGTPTYAIDLAETLIKIIERTNNNPISQYGIYNFSNEGECSWYDFAKEIFLKKEIKIDLKSIPTSAYPTPAKRPVYSVLDKTKIKEVFGIEISEWRMTLKKCIDKND